MATEYITLPGSNNTVTAKLVSRSTDKQILLESIKYLPDFLQNKPVMKDAAKLLDALITETDNDTLNEIYQAYCDTLYKISAYQQLSYAAKVELLKEKGFGYLLDLLQYIYEEKYYQLTTEEQKLITLKEYLEEQTADRLANITMLFNLLYILKGKTAGLELALELVNCPEYIYITWDIIANYKGDWDGDFDSLPMPGGEIEVEKGDAYTISTGDVIFNGVSWHKCTSYTTYLTPRQPFTAELTIWGLPSTTLQARIAEFVRYYMLPYIEVKLEFTAAFDSVYCFPSGDSSSLRTYNLYNYYDNEGTHYQHNLSHDVSQAEWKQSENLDLNLTVGIPTSNDMAFQGTVDLATSYVTSGGNIYYLFGTTKTIPNFITGDALNNLTDEGTLVNFNGTYVQAPLQQDYVLVDIVTGDQINPYYDENGNFVRDTIINYNICLLVEGIHLAKTVEEMGELLIEDFDRNLEDAEVYAGRVTNVILENPSNVIHFTTTTPTVRETCSTEDTIYLAFSDVYVKDNDYTGIGDLGILGSNTYFIYNSMLFYSNDDGTYEQVGKEDTWTDIGASHAVSETYYTPGIKNGNLFYVKNKEIYKLDTTSTGWTNITGYVNEYYTAFGICDGALYRIYLDDNNNVAYEILDNDTGWTYITGALYSQTYEAYGIKNGVMYRISDGVEALTYNGETLSGWDDSFDCISRYHHSNNEYITYGICGGKLYYIQNDTVGLLSKDTDWTAVCGYYNVNSPRTFGYAIKNGALYELQGTEIVLKDDSVTWTDISGCSTTTNTYVLGIGNSYVYLINAKTLKKLSDTSGWTDVFGRYTTSTSASANCYGYGVCNGRLHILHKDEDTLITAVWKINGEGAAVNLADYNISDMLVLLEDGTMVEGIDNIVSQVPVNGEDPTTYDIYVTYETVGFENNTRYLIKTTMSEIYNTYINPEECRDDVYLINLDNEFDTSTGAIANFTQCNITCYGSQKINGNGEAYEFASAQSYIELPTYTTLTNEEFEIYTDLPYTEAIFHFACVVGTDLLPLILDETSTTGIYYGYCEDLLRSGIFLKYDNDGTEQWLKLISVAEGDDQSYYVKYIYNNGYYDIYTSEDGKTYELVFNSVSPIIVNSPKYLGGDGTNFGDGIFYLTDCYLTTEEGQNYLYTNGSYISVNTLSMDLIERIITPENQESQKIFEIQDEDGNLIITLEMDSMYVSRTYECTNSDLTITDTFCLDCLNYGDYEGITTSTLVFSGAYTLDPEKAQDVGNIQTLSNYGVTTVVNNFSADDYILVNPTIGDVLVIVTGDNVDNQVLFQTEEDTAYTNNYLLTSEITLTHSRSEDAAHADSTGIEYELNTDLPGTVTKTLVYNNDEFKIDEDKIYYTDNFTYDSYTAMLDGFNASESFDYCEIPLDLTLESQETIDGIEYTNYSVLPILKIVTNDTYKQKIGEFGDVDIIIGNKEIKYYDADGNEIDNPYANNTDNTEDEDIDSENTDTESTDTEEEIIYTTEVVTDETVYDYQENTEYYLKMEISRESAGLQIDVQETESTEEKDHIQYFEGTASNFSEENYFITSDLLSKYGLAVRFTTDDDVSKDQGLLGIENSWSVCIKDNYFTLCGEDGTAIEASSLEIEENDSFVLLLRTDLDEPDLLGSGSVYVYIGYEGDTVEDYELLFENPITIQDNIWIAYASAGSGMLPFNGSIDLTQSYTETEDDNEDLILERLYSLTQTTVIYISTDKETWEEIQTIITYHVVDDLYFGYDFTGQLDMYGSELLTSYDLGWVIDGVPIDTQIKEDLAAADASYDPDLDEETYTIIEYGIHLDDEPQRWDTITVTYTTVDHAYYMEANTTYYLKLETELDENGECLLTKVGNPTWDSAVISNFSTEDYYTIDFTNEEYIVLHCTTSDIEDQSLCGYIDDNTQSICIKDGYWQFFDDTNYNIIVEATANTNYYFKLYTSSNYIEYSLDGETWITTDLITSFSGYTTFTVGYANSLVFNGTINLNDSYVVTEDGISYLFALYKRITPYISADQKTWYSLVLTPLLTLDNMIAFGQGFSGDLLLYESNLLLADSVYWTANQINIYALEAIEEDGIAADDLVKTVIRDTWNVDPSVYYTEDEIVKINPKDLKLQVDGLPQIGDVITLTYNNWYLFREMNTEYDFKLTYNGDLATISYQEVGGEEYVIYQMSSANYIVNTGYNFWGTLSVKDSTRGGMMLCDYLEWYTYEILYRKYEDDEDSWVKWSEFSVESKYELNQRTGYDLDGLLYMETSYVKLGNLLTPFLAHYNGTYITIVGEVSVDNSGIASLFTENSYLQFNMDSLNIGDTVTLIATIQSLEDQGVSPGVTLEDGYLTVNGAKAIRVYEGFVAQIVYYICDGYMYVTVIGYNSSNFQIGKSNAYTLTLIPYNEELSSTQTGYYVQSSEDAEKLSVYYRVGDDRYDHYNPPADLDWHETSLEKVDSIDYFGTEITSVYVAVIPFGYSYDAAGNATNTNPDGVEYYENDLIEYKIVSTEGLTTTNKTFLCKDKIEKQRSLF